MYNDLVVSAWARKIGAVGFIQLLSRNAENMGQPIETQETDRLNLLASGLSSSLRCMDVRKGPEVDLV